jgi:hypothetical protein
MLEDKLGIEQRYKNDERCLGMWINININIQSEVEIEGRR